MTREDRSGIRASADTEGPPEFSSSPLESAAALLLDREPGRHFFCPGVRSFRIRRTGETLPCADRTGNNPYRSAFRKVSANIFRTENSEIIGIIDVISRILCKSRENYVFIIYSYSSQMCEQSAEKTGEIKIIYRCMQAAAGLLMFVLEK